MRKVRVSSAPSTAHADDPTFALPSDGPVPAGHLVVQGPIGPPGSDGKRPIEVVVDGWRFVLVVEDDARAALRERATRSGDDVGRGGGALEIRAIIPGRVASVAVTPGDTVEAGQTLLAVEAMKMQNELRAPRGGTVSRVAASPGATVEVGDVLVVLE
ncbi:MAG TPA: biotin/lipoyl-containing protein [Candidatus Limnocylindrales bacterium]|nr:biotin/lipoyl-containing protein [Candidatus Limnocylindrales bacterium]